MKSTAYVFARHFRWMQGKFLPRPRIKRWFGAWVCGDRWDGDGGHWGRGDTPAEAYKVWRKGWRP